MAWIEARLILSSELNCVLIYFKRCLSVPLTTAGVPASPRELDGASPTARALRRLLHRGHPARGRRRGMREGSAPLKHGDRQRRRIALYTRHSQSPSETRSSSAIRCTLASMAATIAGGALPQP